MQQSIQKRTASREGSQKKKTPTKKLFSNNNNPKPINPFESIE